MWLKTFLIKNGYRFGRETQEIIDQKTISKAEYSFLLSHTAEQLRLHEEMLIHSGAFHAAHYIEKAVSELELLQECIQNEKDEGENQNDNESSSDTSGTQGAQILKFHEKGSA